VLLLMSSMPRSRAAPPAPRLSQRRTKVRYSMLSEVIRLPDAMRALCFSPPCPSEPPLMPPDDARVASARLIRSARAARRVLPSVRSLRRRDTPRVLVEIDFAARELAPDTREMSVFQTSSMPFAMLDAAIYYAAPSLTPACRPPCSAAPAVSPPSDASVPLPPSCCRHDVHHFQFRRLLPVVMDTAHGSPD